MESALSAAETKGTKFSFTRVEKDFVGEEAHREIRSRLSGHPRAQQLAGEIYAFYGDSLRLIESSRFSSTVFMVRLQHAPLTLESAEIQLRSGTGRGPEALAHELLHLRLFTLGFPLGEIVQIPFPLVYYSREFIGMCHWALNLVQHEINYARFLTLGFDRNEFLERSDAGTGSQERVKAGPQNGYPPEIDFPLWCFEYLRHFLTARHGGMKGSAQEAGRVLDRGSRFYPGLRSVISDIIRWFDLGVLKDPRQYPSQINILFDLLRIPKFTGWAKLEFPRPKNPRAVRVEAWEM